MFKNIIGFKRREGMSIKDFRTYRREIHAPLLFAIPEAAKIRRFVVNYPVAAPSLPDPSFDAVVEAWFDTIDDIDNFYSSENFRTIVDPDHVNFIDLSTVSRMVAEERVLVG